MFFLALIGLTACNNNPQSNPDAVIIPDVVQPGFVHISIVFNQNQLADVRLDSLALWQPGITVGNVMDNLKDKINVGINEHAGLGRFLSSIENISATDTSFWYLCINDTASDKGMDSKTINEGSIISWHYATENPCFMNELKL